MNSLYIVDAQKAVSQMLSECLESRSFQVVGWSDGMNRAMQDLEDLSPDLIVMEMSFHDGTAAKLIEWCQQQYEDARFLIFSDNKEPELIRSALQVGAHGFVEKSVDFEMFLNTVNIVKDGGCFFGFNVTDVLRSAVKNEVVRNVERPDQLTARELEVLELIALGNSNKEIAAKLRLSVKTIDNHRCSLMKKLDLHNVADITRYAVEQRVVQVQFAD